MALVTRRADNGIAPGARPALAGVSLRAGIAVVAGRAIGLGRIRARASGRIAGARVMTLVTRRADHGIAPGARPALAGVSLCTGIAVVAGRAVGLGRI